MSALEEDLKARWRPSPVQIAAVEAYLTHTGAPVHVYTLHILRNKCWGVWTADVVVEPVYAVFEDRDDALVSLVALVKAYRDQHPGVEVTGAYTVHSRGNLWGVFEDIMTEA